MADWAENDYTFRMGLIFYLEEVSQNFPLEKWFHLRRQQ